MNWWQILFFPFAIIYDIVTRIRNQLFDSRIFKIHSYPIFKVISVGNLSVGGTGKTPMVEYLIKWALSRKYSVAVLSRGYGRKTKGLVVGGYNSSASDLGDESLGYYQKFGDMINILVCEKRSKALNYIELNMKDVNMVIMDDGYQHRWVYRDFDLLLTTYHRPFWSDFILPSGLLRESRKACRRADFMIITKCPESYETLEHPYDQLSDAYATFQYGDPVIISGKWKEQVMGLAGLADNEPFFDYINDKWNLNDKFSFPDHYSFTEKDIAKLVHEIGDRFLLCTSKDAVKLKEWTEMSRINWGFLPVEVKFLERENEFLKKLQYAID